MGALQIVLRSLYETVMSVIGHVCFWERVNRDAWSMLARGDASFKRLGTWKAYWAARGIPVGPARLDLFLGVARMAFLLAVLVVLEVVVIWSGIQA